MRKFLPLVVAITFLALSGQAHACRSANLYDSVYGGDWSAAQVCIGYPYRGYVVGSMTFDDQGRLTINYYCAGDVVACGVHITDPDTGYDVTVWLTSWNAIVGAAGEYAMFAYDSDGTIFGLATDCQPGACSAPEQF